jgi:hypothetical protein
MSLCPIVSWKRRPSTANRRVETISQPYIVASMTEAVRVEPGAKALKSAREVGIRPVWHTWERRSTRLSVIRNCGCGPLAAGEIEYKDVEVIWGDGSGGTLPPHCDIIIVTAAVAPSGFYRPACRRPHGVGGRSATPGSQLISSTAMSIRCSPRPYQLFLCEDAAWPERPSRLGERKTSISGTFSRRPSGTCAGLIPSQLHANSHAILSFGAQIQGLGYFGLPFADCSRRETNAPSQGFHS